MQTSGKKKTVLSALRPYSPRGPCGPKENSLKKNHIPCKSYDQQIFYMKAPAQPAPVGACAAALGRKKGRPIGDHQQKGKKGIGPPAGVHQEAGGLKARPPPASGPRGSAIRQPTPRQGTIFFFFLLPRHRKKKKKIVKGTLDAGDPVLSFFLAAWLREAGGSAEAGPFAQRRKPAKNPAPQKLQNPYI